MFPFHVDFSLPMLPLLSKPLYISMRRRKKYFLVHKVKRNRSNWGPCQFLMLASNTLWKFYLSICLEAWKNLHGKHIWKSEEIVWNMWRIFQEKWKTIWTNDEFDWKSERLYMTKIWKSEEFVWKHEGFFFKQSRISMEKWRIRMDKRKNLYGLTVF